MSTKSQRRTRHRKSASDESQLEPIPGATIAGGQDSGPPVPRKKKNARLGRALAVCGIAKKVRNAEQIERDARISQPTADFETGEDLAAAITEKCDLVEIGVEMLKNGGVTKYPNIRVRMWEAIMERMFGKTGPATNEEDRAPEVVLDGLPRPERNPIEGEES